MLLVERHHIQGNHEIVKLCEISKELYNKCNYYMRKAWFGKELLPDINTLVQFVKNEPSFKNLHNTKTAKQTIRKCLTDWTNFKKSLKAWKKDKSKFLRMPKPPKYKDKMAQVIFYKETIKGGQGKKKLNTITPTNGCFGIKSDRDYKQVVITPKKFGFIVDVQYEQNVPNKSTNKGVACVDIGLNNLCAITSDQTTPILVNGRIIKAINQKFNKHRTKRESRKRYFRIENYFHHVSKFIVNWCQEHKIGTIIIGKNDGWKQRQNHGKRNNQNFQSVPFFKLIQKIEYKAMLAGIKVVFTEEAYTSKASFLDRDAIPTYDKGNNLEFSGSRVKRGLYRSSDGTLVNADCNGSANIGRKVIQNSEFLGRLDRSLAARPVRINPLKVSCV
jgi:IS605 OrfB family transposase